MVATVWGSTPTNTGDPMMGSGMGGNMSSGVQQQYPNLPSQHPKQFPMQGKLCMMDNMGHPPSELLTFSLLLEVAQSSCCDYDGEIPLLL